MHWNHRVLRHDHPTDPYYAIHECYYDEGQTEPHSWTSDPIDVVGSSVTELRETLERMLKSLDKPVVALLEHQPHAQPDDERGSE
jgi:hypothetical protein